MFFGGHCVGWLWQGCRRVAGLYISQGYQKHNDRWILTPMDAECRDSESMLNCFAVRVPIVEFDAQPAKC